MPLRCDRILLPILRWGLMKGSTVTVNSEENEACVVASVGVQSVSKSLAAWIEVIVTVSESFCRDPDRDIILLIL